MELPVDEEDNEQVVGVPEPLKVGATTLLNGEPDHDTQCSSHDPASCTRTSDEVGCDKGDNLLAGGLRVGVNHGELGEVDHVGDNVDNREDDDGPGDGLVERDVLVEGDERVQGRAPEERDEVAADGEKDERDIDVEHERSRTRDGWRRQRQGSESRPSSCFQGNEKDEVLTESDTERRARCDRAVLELVVLEAEGDEKAVEEEEHLSKQR